MKRKSEFYKTGSRLAIKNSMGLLKAALEANKIEEDGIACSLTVLSAEESIKAFVCGVRHYFPERSIEGFDKVFRDHEWKHTEIRRVFGLLHQLNHNLAEKGDFIISDISKWRSRSTDESYQNLVNNFLQYAEEYVQLAQIESRFNPDILLWFSKANELKKRGFYVDEKGGKWHDPREFSSNDFEIGFANAEALLTVVMQFLHAAEFLDALNLYHSKFDRDS